MCGIRKSAPFLHLRALFLCETVCGEVRKRFSIAPLHAEMLSHARKALRTPFPLSQSG